MFVLNSLNARQLKALEQFKAKVTVIYLQQLQVALVQTTLKSVYGLIIYNKYPFLESTLK